MKQVNTQATIPIKLWLEDIEDGALAQAINTANLPFAFKHVAIMPDAHQGYGMPIGGVLATKEIVIPNAVGVDIGCGMCAVRTSLGNIPKSKLKLIREAIKERIPVGFNHHKDPQDHNLIPNTEGLFIVDSQYKSALHQIGTLGGGNHFIEIQIGDDDHIWIMIHSGSRNLGYKVAQHYNNVAVKLNQFWYSSVEKSKELAFLPIQSNEAKEYMKEMNYCVEFALANRRLMMEVVKSCFSESLLNYSFKGARIDYEPIINIAHNYARWENHFNSNVIVHRKGATSARKGEIGIIPGSQGSKSYIVKGLGNTESFMSCSHGAGRLMGRNQATKLLDLETELDKMRYILHDMKSTRDLDEADGAYKDIDAVMDNQKDLVKILTELKPLAVVKG